MRPLRVRIDVTEGTATPAQPDPQTIHLNAAQAPRPQKKLLPQPARSPPLPQEAEVSGASLQTHREVTTPPPPPQHQGRLLAEAEDVTSPESAPIPAEPPGLPPAPVLPTAPFKLAHPHTASCARLLQTADIPPETARLVRCHNPWPSEDVLFCPDGALPAFVTGIPALSSGPELWYAVHNHRLEPLQLHAGQSIGILEVVHLAEAPASAPPSSMPSTSSPCQPPLPENLSPLQQQQLNELLMSTKMSSVRGTKTWVILLCWSMGSRPMGLLSANLTGGRILQSGGKKWHRCSKCCPVVSFDPPTAHGLLQ